MPLRDNSFSIHSRFASFPRKHRSVGATAVQWGIVVASTLVFGGTLVSACGGGSGAFAMRAVAPAAAQTAAPSRTATNASQTTPAAPPVEFAPLTQGEARVVVVGLDAGNDPVTIVDESGAWLGQVREHSWMSTVTRQGSHRFYAKRGDDVRMVIAQLSEGHIYYLAVYASREEGFDLRPVGPRHAEFSQRDQWLASFTRLEPTEAAEAMRAQAQAQQASTEAAGNGSWRRLSAMERIDHRLESSDGVAEVHSRFTERGSMFDDTMR